MAKMKEKKRPLKIFIFKSQVAIKALIKDLQQNVLCFFQLEVSVFSFLDVIFIVRVPDSKAVFPSRIRVRIKGSQFNTDPHGSGSETLFRMLPLKIKRRDSHRIT